MRIQDIYSSNTSLIETDIDGEDVKLDQNLNIFTCKIGKDVPLKNLSLSSSTNLTSFPTLPSNLESFYCNGTNLTSLTSVGVDLPNSLIRLQCNDMPNLTSLPNSLPESLQILQCGGTPITSLTPTGVDLPGSLKELGCPFTPLTSLTPVGVDLPDSLEALYCFNTFITTLPNIPSSIRTIVMENNGMVDQDADTIVSNIINKPVYGTDGNVFRVLQQGSTTLTIDPELGSTITTPPYFWSIV
jgi:Leucine-rich repeat (LRR) protein